MKENDVEGFSVYHLDESLIDLGSTNNIQVFDLVRFL